MGNTLFYVNKCYEIFCLVLKSTSLFFYLIITEFSVETEYNCSIIRIVTFITYAVVS